MSSTVPRLTRSTPSNKIGIVHLGLGAFFRSHAALIIEDATKIAGGDWGVLGVSLRSPVIRDALSGQDHVYTAVELSLKGRKTRIVELLGDVVFAPEDPEGLLRTMSDPAVKIVSLTITEKGYCHIPSSGELDINNPEIQADLGASHPSTAIGYLVHALQRRRTAGTQPFSVVSCDNLPNNGRVARNAVTGLAKHIDADLADWISDRGCFPSTMVDRIVPATTPSDIEELETITGYRDKAPVFHEPFCQWVIEDNFVGGERPAFERVPGVHMVQNVAPFERMKVRMLNGTHSSLAYLGYLAGHKTIADTMQDADFRHYVQKLWNSEIIPTLSPPDGIDLNAYAEDLLDRYENPAIKHRTWQIAMDGSQKLPQRILGTIDDNLSKDRDSDGLILAVAAWMRYVGGTDEAGNSIDVRDPLAQRLRALSDAGDSLEEKVDNLVTVQEVFGANVSPYLKDKLKEAYKMVSTEGARLSVAKFLTKRAQ